MSVDTTITPKQSVLVMDSRRNLVSPSGYQNLSFANLTDEMRSDWEAIRIKESSYRSPFFSTDFMEDVAAVMPGIEVVASKRAGSYIAFLPFERRGADAARPVGAGTNDAQGVLCAPRVEASVCDLLREANLKQFTFHAASPEWPGVSKFETGRRAAFAADLTLTPDGYSNFLRKTHRTIARQGQKTRRLAKELGPIRFEFDCSDPKLVQRLIDLKRNQYRRTHTFDILSINWIQQLLYRMHLKGISEPQSEKARGILNVLYAGEHPVALHFGILEGDLLHYWFPVYDSRYSYGSPGTELFLRVADEAETRGIKLIDFGYGDQPYKRKLTNTESELSFGIVDKRPMRRAMYATRRVLKSACKDMRLRNCFKPLARKLFPDFGRDEY